MEGSAETYSPLLLSFSNVVYINKTKQKKICHSDVSGVLFYVYSTVAISFIDN